MSPTWGALHVGTLDEILESATSQNLLPPPGIGSSTLRNTMDGTAGGTAGTAPSMDELYRRMMAARQLAFSRLEATPSLPSLEGWDGGWGAADGEEEEAGWPLKGALLGPITAGPSQSAGGDAAVPQQGSGQVSGSGMGLGMGSHPAAGGPALGGGGARGLQGLGGGGKRRRGEGEPGMSDGMSRDDLEVLAWRGERNVALGLGAGAGVGRLALGAAKRVDVIAGMAVP
jgi:hypothetical protein